MSDTATDQDPARQRLGVWWGNLDPTVKEMFQQIANEQPELVYRVLSGGTVTPVDGQTLDEHLAVEFDAASAIPAVFVPDPPTADPAYPEVNTPFTVSWNEQAGDVAPENHRSIAQLMDESNAVITEQELSGLSGGGPREVTFEGVANEGRYYVLVTANADGVEYGQPPTAQGYRTMGASDFIQVGAYGQAAGPATQQSVFYDYANELSVASNALVGDVTDEAIETVIAAARRLLATAPEEAQSAPLLQRLDMLAGSARGAEESYRSADRTAVSDAVTYLEQASSIFTRLGYSTETFVDNGEYLVQTLESLVRAIWTPSQ